MNLLPDMSKVRSKYDVRRRDLLRVTIVLFTIAFGMLAAIVCFG